jgi:hypothetical protein
VTRQLWVSWTDEDGNEGSARWGGNKVQNWIIDEVTNQATKLLGEPDTVE